ncbi:hypothetical protein D3C83_07000 [compost metagenome]
MLEERIEARVFRNDVEEPARVGRRQNTKIVRDMKIKRVRSASFEHDVFAALSKSLHCKDEFTVQLQVFRAEEDLHPEVLAL